MREYIDFEHVKEHGDFEAVLAHYNITYQGSGGQLRALCPFHDDTKPSLSITLVETAKAKANTYHCHGCQADGSLLDFVAEMEDMDDLREAAQIVGTVSNCTLAPSRKKLNVKRQSLILVFWIRPWKMRSILILMRSPSRILQCRMLKYSMCLFRMV